MKLRTRSLDSPSSFGASRATCSISSLKLTAPALHLQLVEDLADDPPEQPFERGAVDVGERADRLLLVSLEQSAAAVLDLERRQAVAQLRDLVRRQRSRPCGGERRPPLGLGGGALERHRERQRQAAGAEIARHPRREIVEVVADLIGDAERFAVGREEVREAVVALAGE